VYEGGDSGSGLGDAGDGSTTAAAVDTDGSDGSAATVLRQLGSFRRSDRHVQPHVAFLPRLVPRPQEKPPLPPQEEEEEEKEEEGGHLRTATRQVALYNFVVYSRGL